MCLAQLCATCRAIPLHELLWKTYETWKASRHEQTASSTDVPWYTDLATLSSSASGCILCKLAIEGLQACWESQVNDLEASGDIPEGSHLEDAGIPVQESTVYLQSKMSMSISLSRADGHIIDSVATAALQERHGPKAHATLNVSLSGRDMTHSSLEAKFRIITSHDCPTAHIIFGRPVGRRPDSEQAFTQIKSWIDTCSSDHRNCSEMLDAMAPLPTRVLDVGQSDSDIVYLRDSDTKSESSGPYIALSHCWGTTQTFVTTSKSLDDRKLGIAIAELPQTFRDAIVVTRRVGLRYLWIDSLCILQDDVRDWQLESAKMASVYMHSYLVIAASNAAADTQGFLRPRVTPETVPFSRTLLGGQPRCLDLQLLPPEQKRWTVGGDPVGHEPLSNRAWTLQERYLGRRVLLYSSGQMFWECREMSMAEDGDCVIRSGNHLDVLKQTASIEKSIFRPWPASDVRVNYSDWYEMVEKYMDCLLTYQSDRLPALSGLANALATYSRDDYLAGLWMHGLIEGLLWCKSGRKGSAHTRPTAYRAPSWSWASIDGSIEFIVYNFIQRCRWKRGIANYEALASVVEHRIEQEGEDRYGGIRSGWMRLNAPLFQVISVRPRDTQPLFSEDVMVPLRSPACDKVIGIEVERSIVYLQAGFDVDEVQGPLFAILLARLPDGNIGFDPYLDHRFGLILRRVGTGGLYERVGIVDSPVLQKTKLTLTGAFVRVLDSLLPHEERTSLHWTPSVFRPGHNLGEEPEEMPPDPLPQIKGYSTTVTLV